jgi:hypothetical protein
MSSLHERFDVTELPINHVTGEVGRLLSRRLMGT